MALINEPQYMADSFRRNALDPVCVRGGIYAFVRGWPSADGLAFLCVFGFSRKPGIYINSPVSRRHQARKRCFHAGLVVLPTFFYSWRTGHALVVLGCAFFYPVVAKQEIQLITELVDICGNERRAHLLMKKALAFQQAID